MSGLAIYFLVYLVLNGAATLYYIGRGGMKMSEGELWFSLLLTLVNISLIVFVGFGCT
jgi:hypothetical protein